MDKPMVSFEQNYQLAKDTLDLAISDLEDSIYLYERGKYANSIGHLQMSMELACKSFGFFFGIITAEEAREKEIWHKGTNVYIKSTKVILKVINGTAQNLQTVDKVVTKNQDQNNDVYPKKIADFECMIIDARNMMQSFVQHTKDMIDVPGEELGELIKYAEVDFDQLESLLKDTSIIDKNLDRSFAEYQEKLRSAHGNVPIVITEEQLDTIKQLILLIVNWAMVLGPLFILTAVTQPHHNSTRYVDGDLSPIKKYAPGYPLVDQMPRIHDMATKILKKMNELYNLNISLLKDKQEVSSEEIEAIIK